MLNIAICDDDDLIAHQIESVLHNIGGEKTVKIDTDVFYSGNDLVREISSGKKFDLIYMDIQMENGDGYSLILIRAVATRTIILIMTCRSVCLTRMMHRICSVCSGIL